MKTVSIVVLLFLLTGCLGWGDMFATRTWEDGPYFVTDEFDIHPGLHIEIDHNSAHGRVNHIVAIGSNNNFIVAKSNEDKIEYWILDKRKDDPSLNPEEIVEGPYSYHDYIGRKKKLGISSLKFTRRWKD